MDATMKRPRTCYIAGHAGLLGSALQRTLTAQGGTTLITRTHSDLDLRNREAVDRLFAETHPGHVFLAAARVGGIFANAHQPVEFLLDNLAIQTNIINASHAHDVDRLIVIGSNCIYPREAQQPVAETALLTAPFEPTNSAFATAKLAAIELCRAYNHQHGRHFLVAMPASIYGPGDNYDPQHSHVAAAMIRRFHEAKLAGLSSVRIWGSGTPQRELLYSEDCARALIHLAELDDERFNALVHRDFYPLINIGGGQEMSILALARRVAEIVGYSGTIETDATKPDGAPRKLLESSRLSETGWKPKISLDQGLKLAYTDFLERHPLS